MVTTTTTFTNPRPLRRVALLAVSIIACAAIAREGPLSNEQASPPAGNRREAPVAVRPTQAFRAHHAEILEHLGHVDAMATTLATQTSTEQRRTMATVVGFFKEHIAPHAADEERVLYPAVANSAGAGSRLTEVPIYEHTIVSRWIAGLEAESGKAEPDTAEFARGALHLVGLVRSHFEVEEQVLLPVLDRTMTPEQFQREVADKMSN